MSKKQAETPEPRSGFVIHHPEKGVMLGGGRWSNVTPDVLRAPVYSTEDEDYLKELDCEGACYERVTEDKDRPGFVSLTTLQDAGLHKPLSAEELATVQGEMGGKPETKRKKKGH